MDAWLPGVERITSPWKGGTYRTDVPWRFVFHTTEVVPSSVDGARSMAARHEHPPHLWAWPEQDWVAQTVPLDRSAAALRQPEAPAARRTNKARAIQVEVIGRAAETHDWPAAWWEWLGRRVLAPVVLAGVPLDLGRVAPLTGSDGYGLKGAVRMGWDDWLAYDGVCAHSNVPGNDHWDIGKGRLDLVVAAARRAIAPDEEEDPFMALTDEEQREILARLRRLTPFPPERIDRKGMKQPAGQGVEADPSVRWLIETTGNVRNLVRAVALLAEQRPASVDVDGLAADIAAALDDELAAALAAELARRLGSG